MVLRAKRGISYMGDVVVDDVAFVDCAPPITSNLSCHNNEFICANGHCISKDNLCDFIDHCGDGSDENHYICSEKQIYHPLFCHLFPDVFFFSTVSQLSVTDFVYGITLLLTHILY